MKSIAIYARVSSEQQAKQATVESQMAALKERVAADGHVMLPHDVYVDDGFSGSTRLRPALERLRDRVAEGSVDRLYVHSPDRLARKYAYQVLLLDELRKHGVTVVFLNAPSGTTAEDELLVQVQGRIAEYERAKILERSRRGKIHRARQGEISPLGSAPYGFAYIKKRDGAVASYRVLLHEAKVVRDIFHAFVDEQKSISDTRVNSPRAMSQHAEARRAGVGRRYGPSFAIRRTWAKLPSEKARWPPSADCCVLVVAAVLRRVDSQVRANEHRPIGGYGSMCRRSFRVSNSRRRKRNSNVTSVWRSATRAQHATCCRG
jgi:DNA invertase Pin-like site-specific DNA recombinase